MSPLSGKPAPVAALHVCSGSHLGARLELEAGTWVLGADDSCDLILDGLAPRHACLEIASAPSGAVTVSLAPLDGVVRRQGEEDIFPPEAGGQAQRHALDAGRAWYLGKICFAWTLPDADTPDIEPETTGERAAASQKNEEERSPAGNEVATASSEKALQGDNNLSEAGSVLPVEMPEPSPAVEKRRPRTRFLLLIILAVLLAAMSAALTPSTPEPWQYPEIVEKYLKDAGVTGLTVSARTPGVEVRGAVDDDAAMIRLRDMARSLQFPVYLEVGVREDILRAVRSSLGIRGFHPEVSIDVGEDGGAARLKVAAYMKDVPLEEAAFSALESEVPGLPPVDRRIVHEKELAPLLEEGLKKSGLSSVRLLFLPGRVDFAGNIPPENEAALNAIRRETEAQLGIPLYGGIENGSSAAAPELSVEAAGAAGGELAPASPLPRTLGRADAEVVDGDPMEGLRVTGVTMSPMRFVTTADGRRLFEGALLPSGWTLEDIDTKMLTLRRGERIFTYRLRGSR